MAYEHPITLDRIDNGFVMRWYEGREMVSRKKFVATPLDVAELLTDLFPEFEPQEPIFGDGFEGADATALLPGPTPPEDTHHVPVADHREL